MNNFDLVTLINTKLTIEEIHFSNNDLPFPRTTGPKDSQYPAI